MSADAEARRRFGSARVAHLATADARGVPHVVPVCFALEGDAVYTAIDSKPKRTTRLRRLRNLEENPHASLLVDFYDDADWSRLWWVRADGSGGEAGARERARGFELLAARYAQYRVDPPTGGVIVVRVERWTAWSASA
jgi:PPOX class probable F420-dependent enzyme